MKFLMFFFLYMLDWTKGRKMDRFNLILAKEKI
jgi:hypothetical protein